MLVKAFLKAGILTEDGAVRDTITGIPQGGSVTRKVHVVSGSSGGSPRHLGGYGREEDRTGE